MTLLKLDRLGEWNPQLFRELKGRLKPRNILITVAVSLLGQLLILMSFASQLPTPILDGPANNRYCTGKSRDYSDPSCLSNHFQGFEINWQLWWQDVFIWLSAIGVVALLVVGTYMLISDLSKEEQRSTLNFLRLTPQSSQSILIGKMLGVPILLYLTGFLAWPLHLVAGLSGQMPFNMILGFYVVLGASCLFFYSVALLFGLFGTWLGGFQAWLGSGTVLMFLYVMTAMSASNSDMVTQYPLDWITLFNPSILLTYLTGTNSLNAAATYQKFKGLEPLTFWGLPVGASVWSALGLMVLNYSLWTYWVWQGLMRCFHKPSATLLGKQHSYWLTACFEAVLLGFALNPKTWGGYPKGLFENFQMVLVFNLLLFLCLMAALSPHRQAMQDWARYRHQKRSSRKGGVVSDLIWGEKSPALVAVVLNIAIASSILLSWIMLWPASTYKMPALWALLLNMSLIIVYAATAQLMLLMKMPKRAPWASATVGLMIVLPPIVFAFLSLEPTKNASVWLFSAFPWMAVEHTTGMSVFLAIIVQSLATGLLSLQLTRQLHKAGESSTKALLSERSPAAL
ncbi:MAG TPA: ABC transporter permease [Cyanobacteria bacterium UBA8543]|nr:ABC transporter permease [Cyanobacteria bacterium UBA8543]